MYYTALGPNNPITIITWNVNSLRKRYTHVIGLLTIDKPTILFLQETKLEDVEMAKLAFDPQYFIAYTGTKQLNGVAIFSTLPFVGSTLTQIPGCPESLHRFIQVHINGYILINVYVHQGQLIDSTPYRSKLIFLRALISHIDGLRISLPTQRVIIGGDFNIIPTDADLYNPDHPDWETHAMCSHKERQLYENILRLGYEDIVAQRLPHRPFTHWIYYRSATDRRQGFRIDYFFTPSVISHQITSANVLLHWRAMPEASDHAPVRITINPNH